MPNLGTNALFGYFSARILKDYYHSRNQHLKFLIHECLIHTVNFGIRFTEGPGTGALYKVSRQ